jgi:murein DD-endopeptidase MepM/ murein hydrolase activator NlpD
MRKAGMVVSFLVAIFMVVALSALVYNYLEWEKPQVKIQDTFDMIGQKRSVTFNLTDMRSGIRSVTVSMIQKEHPFEVYAEEVPEDGVSQKTVTTELNPRKLKMKDGPAVLQIKVVDYSPLRNTTIVRRNVTIDMVPLRASLLSMAHNVNPGGTCMAVYTLSKTASRSGVLCGSLFSPGYPQLTPKGKTFYVCYFPVPMDVSQATVMHVVADDRAGNQVVVPIPFYIRTAWRFVADKLGIGADFITRKAAEFQQEYPELEGKPVEDAFTTINVQIRKQNEDTITKVSLKTSPKQLWDGGEFLMMRNGATKAHFGDRRTYLLDNRPIGESLHQGIDLASTEHAPVEAANSGIVIFASNLGIYGNAVIIDHGQGITSLYGHMSALQVSEGQQVKKGQVIGTTGSTGWAGGDHLHVSILVNGVFVNPIEWWDPHWLKDNVLRKIDDVQAAL